MKKYELEILKSQLNIEEKELKKLKAIYAEALEDIKRKVKLHNGKIGIMINEWDDLDDVQKSIFQSQIYQRKYQKSLQRQIDKIIKNMNTKQYKSVSEYLKDCYEHGFVSTMYSLHKQGIPLILPIDQEAVVRASRLDSKISQKLYGSYVNELKKHIQSEISRGIATASSYSEIARNLDNRSKIGINKAMRIVRTEGHNVQISGTLTAMKRAKDAGADILKEWSATLDRRTRASHARLDGEIRELDERFSNGMMYPSDSVGGASEVINCRCALLQRARWTLDENTLNELKERARFHGLVQNDSKAYGHYKAKNTFAVFKKRYLKSALITDTDKKAIYDYMSVKSYVINEKLRNDITLTPIEDHFIIQLDNALDKMPLYAGNLQRSLYFGSDRATKKFVAAYAVGKVITYQEYISATKGETYNPDGQVQIYIQDSQNGKDISELNSNEEEVLYKREQSFYVTDVEEQDGTYHIFMREYNE